MKFITHICILLFLTSTAFSQSDRDKCNVIHKKVDENAKFVNDTPGLLKYFQNELLPVFYECVEIDSTIVTSLVMTLLIDQYGKVKDATFKSSEINFGCKERLKGKLLTMRGWTPAKIKAGNVCSYYIWPISCIKWEFVEGSK